MSSENHIYTFYYIYKKRLPLPFTYDNEKKFTPFFFFLSFLVLYKLCIIKIYLCTKDFFVFYFFSPYGMVMGMWYEWWVKGPVCPGPFQTSGGGEKMPEVGRTHGRVLGAAPACAPGASPGTSQGDTREGRGRAGGGVHWLV